MHSIPAHLVSAQGIKKDSESKNGEVFGPHFALQSQEQFSFTLLSL
jgi:hypothetical protein